MKKVTFEEGIVVEFDSVGKCGNINDDAVKEQECDSLSVDNEAIYYNCSIDGCTSLILACACAGIDIDSPAFREAVSTTLEAIGNNYD